MPNTYQYDPEDDVVENSYPLIVFALGSSGVQNPGLILYNPWIENDPRKNIVQIAKAPVAQAIP